MRAHLNRLSAVLTNTVSNLMHTAQAVANNPMVQKTALLASLYLAYANADAIADKMAATTAQLQEELGNMFNTCKIAADNMIACEMSNQYTNEITAAIQSGKKNVADIVATTMAKLPPNMPAQSRQMLQNTLTLAATKMLSGTKFVSNACKLFEPAVQALKAAGLWEKCSRMPMARANEQLSVETTLHPEL